MDARQAINKRRGSTTAWGVGDMEREGKDEVEWASKRRSRKEALGSVAEQPEGITLVIN